MSKASGLRFSCAIDRRADGADHVGVNQDGGAQKLKRVVFVAQYLNDAPIRVGFLVVGNNGIFQNRVLPRSYVALSSEEVVVLSWYLYQYLHGLALRLVQHSNPNASKSWPWCSAKYLSKSLSVCAIDRVSQPQVLQFTITASPWWAKRKRANSSLSTCRPKFGVGDSSNFLSRASNFCQNWHPDPTRLAKPDSKLLIPSTTSLQDRTVLPGIIFAENGDQPYFQRCSKVKRGKL